MRSDDDFVVGVFSARAEVSRRVEGNRRDGHQRNLPQVDRAKKTRAPYFPGATRERGRPALGWPTLRRRPQRAYAPGPTACRQSSSTPRAPCRRSATAFSRAAESPNSPCWKGSTPWSATPATTPSARRSGTGSPWSSLPYGTIRPLSTAGTSMPASPARIWTPVPPTTGAGGQTWSPRTARCGCSSCARTWVRTTPPPASRRLPPGCRTGAGARGRDGPGGQGTGPARGVCHQASPARVRHGQGRGRLPLPPVPGARRPTAPRNESALPGPAEAHPDPAAPACAKGRDLLTRRDRDGRPVDMAGDRRLRPAPARSATGHRPPQALRETDRTAQAYPRSRPTGVQKPAHEDRLAGQRTVPLNARARKATWFEEPPSGRPSRRGPRPRDRRGIQPPRPSQSRHETTESQH